MPATSAAICLWRPSSHGVEYLIVHPGGPFWAKKDKGAWSLPKGEYNPAEEDGLVATRREFAEELGHAAPADEYLELGETRQKSGKRILAWAAQGDLDVEAITSNTFEIEWPPRSGKRQAFPEVDRAVWCSAPEAAAKLNAAQVVLIERLAVAIDPDY